MKKIILLCLIISSAFAADVFAQTLSYEDALDMALSEATVLHDIDIALRNMSLERRVLSDELLRVQNGGRTLQQHLMQEAAWELDNTIFALSTMQSIIGQQIGDALSDLQTGIVGEGINEQVLASLTTLFRASAPDFSASLGVMHEQRNELSREIRRMNENSDEIRRGTERNLNDFDRQAEMLRLQREQAELAVEYVLRSMIVTIAELDRQTELSIAEIALEEINLERMIVMHEVGMLSEYDLGQVRHGLVQRRAQLDELNRGRATLMQSLNHMLGLELTQDTVIEFETLTSPKCLEDSLEGIADTHMLRASQLMLESVMDARWVITGNNRELIVSASDRRRALDADRRTRNLWDISDADEDEEEQIENIRRNITLQENVERAITSHEQTERAMETALRRGFSDFESLVSRYESLQEELSRAEENVAMAIQNLELGTGTQFQIEAARLAVLQAERGIDSIIGEKWMLTLRLQNPDLL
ncbi:MAG: hypothetical protein FWF78_06260 [Defluviitaleaceae bacterium]|nr:hypothetical protein [Defluviitaleaceae bacterium]